MIGIHGIFSARPFNKKELQNILFKETKNRFLIYQSISRGLLAKISLDKFKRDKVFQKYDENVVCIDGFLLNLNKLLIESKTEDFCALIMKLYEKDFTSFPLKLLGSFHGFMYFGKENRIILFTDHIGSRPIFFFHDKAENTFIFSSSFPNIVKIMLCLGYIPRLNKEAAYCLLTFGHMLGDLTLVEGVKKLPPGSMLIYNDDEFSINQYYRLSSNPLISDSEEECINKIAIKIAEAVHAEYTKDLEHGYQHLATLSGGLDSRTSLAFAKKLGFNNITCFTYSQSNYLDEKIAKKITSENNINWIFFPLDYGNHIIKYVDSIIDFNGGLFNYIGICNLYPWLRKLPLEKYGLLHTGTLGGEIFGEYVVYLPHRKYQSLRYFLGGECSSRLLKHISHLVDKELSKFDNTELFKFYNIGVNAQLLSMNIINQFIDATSPYLFRPLLEYVMKMPKEYKIDKKLYTKMINTYIPEFAKYKWERYRISPKYPLYRIKGYKTALSFYIKIISRFTPYYSMNPFEHWYRKNNILKKGLNLLFKSNIDALEDSSGLRNDCEYLFEEGDFLEKTTVITLLKALKHLQVSC